MSNTTQSSLGFQSNSPLIGLIWFETIAACIALVLTLSSLLIIYLLFSHSYGLGFLGNFLSLIVFYSQKEFREISTGLLFMFITISNFFHLVSLAIEFLTIYNIIIFRQGFLQCQFTFYVQNISRAMSTYFMVTVALDRFIRTELPMRSKKICTKQNILILTCIYFIIFAIFWSFYFYPYISQDPITGSCIYDTTKIVFYYFIINLYMPIRTVFICFIPVIIMFLANLKMLMNIRHSKRRVTNATTIPTTETNLPAPYGSDVQDKKAKRRLSALDRMLFYMMVANITIFIITQIPFHIYCCIRNSLTGLDSSTAQLVRAILLIWSSLYFGIAFYFYCLASPLFRQKFIKMLQKIICYHNMNRLRGSMGRSTG